MAAYAALASLSQITDLTTNQNKSLFPVYAQEKIRSIHEYVLALLSFLEDYPEKAKHSEGKMRDVAHETEDAIEQLMWQQSYNKWIKLSSGIYEEQLRNITENFCLIAGDIMDERPAYSPVSISSSSSRIAPIGNGVAIGLDDDVMAMKDRLCWLSSRLQVIPIVGMGGIGKATLARTVYDSPLIMGYFHIRVWLTISQDYSEERIFFDLLDSMNLMENENDENDIVSRNLKKGIVSRNVKATSRKDVVYKNLKGRRYLIVMDDVWNSKVWDDVRNIFPDDGNGSRVMLTTRLLDLAAYPESSSHPHEMRLMKECQSWDLLKRELFASHNCPPELEDVGKEIARSCVGLPLAVVLVAGFLSAVNKTRSSWEEIAKNVSSIVGQELEGILSLSYRHLPHHLRPCFLYLGLFPEDANIRASTLYKLWLAEGFLKHQNKCDKSLEDETEGYLVDLVKRNLVTVTSRKSNGKIKWCNLHDMVRELCIRKAHNEKFLHVIDGCVAPQGMISERRISCFWRSYQYEICSPSTRTILYFQGQAFSGHFQSQEFSSHFLAQTQIFPSWPAFTDQTINRLLRVLYAVDHTSVELFSKVFELYHLRYLALICPSNIPPDISNLMHLQTLIILPDFRQLRRLWKVTKHVSPLSLPLEIWSMTQLRHLVFSRSYILPYPPLDASTLPLENLQTLSFVASLVCSERILKMIPNLKKLGIVYNRNEDYKLHNLIHLCQLETLEVTMYWDSSWQRQNPRFPCTLKKLSLFGARLPWKDMAVIGALPNLQVLKIQCLAYDGEMWETNDGEFLELKYLLIEESNLRHWITESSHFPRLKSLVLHDCWILSQIPDCIGDIPTLDLIEVDDMNKSLVDSAKKLQQDQLENYGNDALQVRCIHSKFKQAKTLEMKPRLNKEKLLPGNR